MRTKTLLLTAAIGAAGIATSMAQVFSVNAVGYVVTTVPANRFALISNPLNAANNTINELFKGLPPGTTIYKYTGTAFDVGVFDDIDNNYGSLGTQELHPGDGVFIKNNSNADFSITFVGEVPQGQLTTQLPVGFSIRSSQVPQAGTPEELGLQGVIGDQLYKFDVGTQAYSASSFDDLDNKFLPTVTLNVGEAFFLRKTTAGTWTRTFSVN